MSEFEQCDYFAKRERQQREFARRATRPDIIAFHDTLARHYAALVEETRGPRSGGAR